MLPSKDIRPVTYLKTNTAKLLREVRDGRPIVITRNGRAQAVVMDVASFEALTRARALVQLVEMSRAQVRVGKTVAHAKAMRQVARRPARKVAK